MLLLVRGIEDCQAGEGLGGDLGIHARRRALEQTQAFLPLAWAAQTPSQILLIRRDVRVPIIQVDIEGPTKRGLRSGGVPALVQKQAQIGGGACRRRVAGAMPVFLVGERLLEKRSEADRLGGCSQEHSTTPGRGQT